MHTYIPLKPHSTGHPVGGGYKCGACGLEGLAYGEPHYRSGDGSSSQICEPAVPAMLTNNHPQRAFAGKPITARPAIGPGMGNILEHRESDGVWRATDLGPPMEDYTVPATSEPGVIDETTPIDQAQVPGAPASDFPAGAVPPSPVPASQNTQGGAMSTTTVADEELV